MKQRESVYEAVVTVLGAAYDPSTAVALSADERTQVVGLIVKDIVDGKVDFSDEAAAKYDSEAKIKTYVSGLVSNWLRRDERLNGGGKYSPTKTGTRTKTGDEQLSALKNLKKQMVAAGNTVDLPKVVEAITKRETELKAATAQSISVDLSQVPADLVEQLGL